MTCWIVTDTSERLVTREATPGDHWFPGGPGRTTNPEEFDYLMTGLETLVFDVYDDDTVVYPGHGDDTTLGAERPNLAEWRERGW